MAAQYDEDDDNSTEESASTARPVDASLQLQSATSSNAHVDVDRGDQWAGGATPPPELFCPITHSLLMDPVSTLDGTVYERAAIERWLSDHGTSPLTGEALPSKVLIPQHALRALASSWAERTW